ncbi:hypothetical protein CBE01nite_35480 [Clostridium beijerinckii]|uniref:HNH endonuclease n=1 Tax=Clostridium beijerinckii TaxID=1520 RepID=A0AB74VHR8_CLOBE|nr:HNH endonuclease [Clostridium beijerinckii]NRT32428.1 5-methylcytosine-specific restriction endonuclease McrA [Clostridium beijerinckii]NRT48144.1 5-methylcytosine-specific restriction endonuclease McrA [Clostridium beijerinckii]NRZ23559.1 5-methylcytosine-specific restriction endonuclease McrA [Clostridium beijerinckii]NRZ25158.1 5-methylcytosine-specific restriction endonuclease McrA [Clostridium beijerinckii]NYB99872.1 5-methylcytosine-specific restriction endonuclease McrA [Clostridium 
MICKRCSRCGKRIQTGSKCNCSQKRYKEYDKDKINSKEKKFYSSDQWNKIKDKAKELYEYIDIYSYYVSNKLEYGQTVHHIVPIKREWEKRFALDNLIYLTESNHRVIHNRMENGEYNEVINELNELVARFKKEFDIEE